MIQTSIVALPLLEEALPQQEHNAHIDGMMPIFAADRCNCMIYHDLHPISDIASDLVIYPVSDYPHLRSVQTVPVVITEADRVAAEYPLAWQRISGKMTLVALTCLEAGEDSPATSVQADGEPLLLALKSYPFAVGAIDETTSLPVLYDRAPVREAAKPLPLYDRNGKLHMHALRRLAAARIFTHGARLTALLSQRLEECGALQPWEFALQFDKRAISLSGLFILDRDIKMKHQKINLIINEYGRDVVRLCELHELSLYRMHNLASRYAKISYS
ncbi:SapC family protein [Pseudochelatococcus sp. B33]